MLLFPHFILFLFTCLCVSIAEMMPIGLFTKAICLSWDPQILESKGINKHILTKYYHGQLSALHMPCSKFARQREALSPHCNVWLTSVTGGECRPVCDQTGERWLCRVVFCRCDYLLAGLVSAHWGAVQKICIFTLSQGCWHLESNFPMKKKMK